MCVSRKSETLAIAAIEPLRYVQLRIDYHLLVGMDDEHHALFQDRLVLDRDVARRDGARAHAMATPVHVGRMVVFFIVPGVDQNGIDRAGDIRNYMPRGTQSMRRD